MTKIGLAVAAILSLIALLTWLSLRAINPEAERFDRALSELDRFATVEARLRRDVLSARAGILRNYDPLVRETDELDDSLSWLREMAAVDPEMTPALDRLTMTLTREESLVERFKSSNALLQNSLAYFALFSRQLGAPNSADPLAPAISALAAAMLRLTLDTSAPSADDVQNQLDEIARQPSASGDSEASRALLLAHGRLLHHLLPATDGLLRTLNILPLKRNQGVLRAIIMHRQIASRNSARQFRAWLYITSLVLVGFLVYVGLQLLVRARALRFIAAFEHVIASISMSFVGAREEDLGPVIRQALEQMASSGGAERAYLVVSDQSVRTHSWCQAGETFPAGWPERALLLADRFRPLVDGVVRIPDVARLPPGDDKAALVAIGLRSWTCAFRKGTDGISILLGLDNPKVSKSGRRLGRVSLMRTALDVFFNALNRQSLEQERARLEARLIRASRLESVGVFASGIAHNFNNIIGAILGYTEMAWEHDANNRHFSTILTQIRQAAERARELVDQILVFGQRRDVSRSTVHVQALLAEAVALVRASLPPSLDLAVGQPPESAVVSGVPSQLQQVILNLCNNAAQSMDHSGGIELVVDLCDVAATQQLSHGVLAAGPYVRIAVNDSGRGIDEAELERIFEPFFTTRVNGSGLGLATIREIVREHGGAINVRSTVKVGTRFEVWIPRIVAVPAVDENTAPPFGSGETVLIIETDPDRLFHDEEILAALGYEPIGFRHAADAAAACRASPERFDVVLVGHSGAMTSGLAIAGLVHGVAPTLPIVLAAAATGELCADALVATGISDIVPWPITGAGAATSLQSCLQRRGRG
jgi:signal transduction histidine kinase